MFRFFSGEYLYGKEIVALLEGIDHVIRYNLGSPWIDNGERFIAAALNPLDSYSSYDEIRNEVEKVKDERIGDEGVTLYVLWAENTIGEAGVTIEDPVLGTTVSADPDGEGGLDQDTQKPRPTVSVNDGNYHVYMKGNSPAVYWKQGDGLFTGEFTADSTYTASGEIEAALGYYFDPNVTLSVNGKGTDAFSYDAFRLGFTADLAAARDEFYAYSGDGGSWNREPDETLDFTFKRTVSDGSTYDSFIGIKVDDKDVERIDANYTAAPESSVVIRLQPAYLETLSAGEHTLTAYFTGGKTASAKFTVTKKENSRPDKTSETAYRIPVTGIE